MQMVWQNYDRFQAEGAPQPNTPKCRAQQVNPIDQQPIPSPLGKTHSEKPCASA
jgi:hypothetical protein